jgi:hypothetical protein
MAPPPPPQIGFFVNLAKAIFVPHRPHHHSKVISLSIKTQNVTKLIVVADNTQAQCPLVVNY